MRQSHSQLLLQQYRRLRPKRKWSKTRQFIVPLKPNWNKYSIYNNGACTRKEFWSFEAVSKLAKARTKPWPSSFRWLRRVLARVFVHPFC